MEDYRDELLIDRNALDECLISQADVFYRICRDYADAVSERDEAYENVKQTDASLNLTVRNDFEIQGKKATESVISACVLNHEDHMQAVQEHLEAKKRADQLSALKEAFQQRSYMLRELVQLYLSGYFLEESQKASTPSSQEISHQRQRSRLAEKRKDHH